MINDEEIGKDVEGSGTSLEYAWSDCGKTCSRSAMKTDHQAEFEPGTSRICSGSATHITITITRH
jgi:hypothetical protein